MKNDPQPAAPKPPRAAWLLPLLLFCLLTVPGGGYLVWMGSRAAFPQIKSKPQASLMTKAALAGVTVEDPLPLLNLQSWFSGDFQMRFGRWFGQHFVLRPEMVKTDNQIVYTVFRKSNTPSAGLIVGRGKMLYEDVYVREYCGLYRPPPAAMTEQMVADMEDVGARLRARGIGFVVCIAPSKPAIYPENLPPAYVAQKSNHTPRSYEVAVKSLKRRGVLTVDGHKALMEAKVARPNDILFCLGGTHYSDLGMLYMLRPLLRAIETAGRKPVPTLRWDTPVPVDNTPSLRDMDLALLLNVWNPPNHFYSPHPVAVFDTPSQSNRVRHVTIVGDSFCWQPVNLLGDKRVFEHLDFYYYYHNEHWRYPDRRSMPLGSMADEWENTLLKSDVIVLEVCETQLRNTGETHFNAFLQDAKRCLPANPPRK